MNLELGGKQQTVQKKAMQTSYDSIYVINTDVIGIAAAVF